MEEREETTETRDAHAFARIGGQLKAEHGDVSWSRCKRGPVFFRRPTDREYLSWQAAEKDLRAQALEVVCQSCFLGVIVNGELLTGQAAWNDVRQDEGPAFVDGQAVNSAGDQVLRLAGMRRREGGFL